MTDKPKLATARLAPRVDRRERILFVAFVLMVVLYAVWHIGGPIVSQRTLNTLKGMTPQEVVHTIGKPSAIDDDQTWAYLRFCNPGWLVIEFDDHGRVAGFDHEYAFK
jgi:outer membrane protein assembly factor BamE (lipoprotein component of BamABCDE complex)